MPQRLWSKGRSAVGTSNFLQLTVSAFTFRIFSILEKSFKGVASTFGHLVATSRGKSVGRVVPKATKS